MQRQTFGFAALIALGPFAMGLAPVLAQDPPPPPPPVAAPPVTEPPAAQAPVTQPPVAQPPALPTPAAEPDLVLKPEQPPRPIDPQRLREQIIAMEGLLTSAVKTGATSAARQMQALEPGIQLFTGVARAKGFYLDDYGVFFHVEIPGVSPSVAWLLETMERERAFDRSAQPRRTGSASVGFDPNAAYVLAVQQKLIDAMLDYRIDLQPAEWLTVAARDGEGPANPGQIVESAMMILRIRSSDLADFHAGRITREELRARVEVREF